MKLSVHAFWIIVLLYIGFTIGFFVFYPDSGPKVENKIKSHESSGLSQQDIRIQNYGIKLPITTEAQLEELIRHVQIVENLRMEYIIIQREEMLVRGGER